MFTAEQYREKAAPWFVPPLVIPIAFAILWVGFVLCRGRVFANSTFPAELRPAITRGVPLRWNEQRDT